MSETTNSNNITLKKRKASRILRSELFTKGFFEEKDLSSEHKDAKTHREVKCLNCL
ncbi:5033_t:CDS:1, partial [Ambispora gerdemannii]